MVPDRIATHILSFENEQPEFYTGNYAEYEVYRQSSFRDTAATKLQSIKRLRVNFLSKKPALELVFLFSEIINTNRGLCDKAKLQDDLVLVRFNVILLHVLYLL